MISVARKKKEENTSHSHRVNIADIQRPISKCGKESSREMDKKCI